MVYAIFLRRVFFLLQINRMNKNIEKSNEFRGGPKVRETTLVYSLSKSESVDNHRYQCQVRELYTV